MDNPEALTTLLKNWRSGDAAASAALMEAVYSTLRRVAAHYLRGERPDHTLSPTALVNEVYLRFAASGDIDWQSRAHFFAVAAQQIRRILVNYARDRHALKRGGKQVKLALTEVNGLAQPYDEDIVELDGALTQLAELDERAARVVELRYFGGLTEREAAEVIGISVTTLKRDWAFARAWLTSRLSRK
jgi:RNA polymerase sigma factor (TIGR02999 family)